MNMPKQLTAIVAMLMLLITQISGAFSPAMAFSLTSDMPCSTHATSHHSLQSDANAELLTDHDMAQFEMSTSMKMDCCDSDGVDACCDGQCGCFAFAATCVFIHAQLSDGTLPSTNDAFRDVLSPPHSAFSALLIRPPIQSQA